MNESDELSILNDPKFQKLLTRRSRLRWGLTGLLVVAYLAYGMAGIYASDLLGASFMGSSISWWIIIGASLIALAIVLSLVYIRLITKLYSSQSSDVSGEQ